MALVYTRGFFSLHSLSLEADRKSPPVTQSPHSSPSHSVGTGCHNLPLGSQSSYELLISKDSMFQFHFTDM